MSTHEVTWSTFLREPTVVDRWLEHGDVLLRRREGEPLRLVRDSAGASERQALHEALRLLGGGSARRKLRLDEVEITRRLPWTRFLPPKDRKVFVSEFLEQLEACLDLGEFAAVSRLLQEWRSTAALHAEGLSEKLKGPLREVGGKVRRP